MTGKLVGCGLGNYPIRLRVNGNLVGCRLRTYIRLRVNGDLVGCRLRTYIRLWVNGNLVGCG